VSPRKNDVLDRSAHWRHLANTIEPFICYGDAAFLSNYTDHLNYSIEPFICGGDAVFLSNYAHHFLNFSVNVESTRTWTTLT